MNTDRGRALPWIALAAVLVFVAAGPPSPPGSVPVKRQRGVASTRPAPVALAPGDPAPRIGGTTLAGEEYDGDWSANRLTLVNFWGVWCAPCKAEMPVLEKLLRSHERDGLRIVGLEVQRATPESSRAFVDAIGVTYPIVAVGGEALTDWGGVSIYPTTFLVGSDGRVVRKYVGATQAEIDGLVADVKALLAGKPLETRMPAAEPAEAVPTPR